jgi:hypothetical protein
MLLRDFLLLRKWPHHHPFGFCGLLVSGTMQFYGGKADKQTREPKFKNDKKNIL